MHLTERSEKITFSWEKVYSPTRPPWISLSRILPLSAKAVRPLNILNLGLDNIEVIACELLEQFGA